MKKLMKAALVVVMTGLSLIVVGGCDPNGPGRDGCLVACGAGCDAKEPYDRTCYKGCIDSCGSIYPRALSSANDLTLVQCGASCGAAVDPDECSDTCLSSQ